MKPFFRRTKYCSQKQGEHAAIHCLFVRHQFLLKLIRYWEHELISFFLTKNSFVFVEETATLSQILRTA